MALTYEETEKYLRIAADSGKSSQCMYLMGLYLALGKVFNADKEQAISYLKRAVEMKHHQSYAVLGVLYLGEQRRVQDAVSLFQEAIRVGDAFGLNCYGFCHFINKNTTNAAQLFKMAAESDDPSGQNNYGIVLILGLGIKQNVSLGLEYLSRAMVKQNPSAYKNLAYIYENGVNVPVDIKKSEMYKLGKGYKYRIYLNIDMTQLRNYNFNVL